LTQAEAFLGSAEHFVLARPSRRHQGAFVMKR